MGLIITIAIVIGFLVFLYWTQKKHMTDTSISTNNKDNPVDSMIKTKFKLFQGLRSQEEDQQMLDKIHDMCFREITLFFAKNLSEEKRLEFEKKAESESDEDKRAELFNTYLSDIPDYQSRLNKHIDQYLDKIIEASLNTKKS